MDVSQILSSSKYKTTVEKDIPLDVDVGYLTVTDHNPIRSEVYSTDTEEHLQNVARDGAQILINSLFMLPTQSSPDGPLATLPPPTTQLPRSKPLPKLKAPTKWERFAAAKGIQKRRHDKKEWDDEKQEWVNSWGVQGKRREKEGQWITEVPDDAEADYDPAKVARDERKSHIAKNKIQQTKNTNWSHGNRSSITDNIELTLATSRVSTASMGKHDRKLDGEKKLRGVKRKFNPTEASANIEKHTSLALISKLNGIQGRTKFKSKATIGRTKQ